MESMLPPPIITAYRGFPMARKAPALCQSGWASTATRKPSSSSTRAMMAVPKLGWSI